MTIQSLCSAIRSQLYFSQITAWTDLLKSASSLDLDIKNNPRIKCKLSETVSIKPVAIQLGSSSLSATPSQSLASPPLPKILKPKLDILYRIRPYDTISNFKNKPNIHNFPDAKISNNLIVKVCLKSLPRLSSIPKLDDYQTSSEPLTPPIFISPEQQSSTSSSVPFDRSLPLGTFKSSTPKSLQYTSVSTTGTTSSTATTSLPTTTKAPQGAIGIGRIKYGYFLKICLHIIFIN